MRLWTLHPRYLDSKGLVAVWREALLAQKVLLGQMKGYRNHPQLVRFRAQADPLAAIATFLEAVALEAQNRGYRFDVSKIGAGRFSGQIDETEGQVRHEWFHLLGKLQQRAPTLYAQWQDVALPRPHPLFTIVPGDVREWERV